MGLLNEFREFAVKGNMFDLAIGIMIGTAFNNSVSALVKYILTPPIGYLTNGVDVSDLKTVLIPALHNQDGETVKNALILEYGLFLESLIDFVIIAFTIFLLAKLVNSLRRKAEDVSNKSVPTPKDIQLLSDILMELKSLGNVMSAKESSRSKPAE